MSDPRELREYDKNGTGDNINKPSATYSATYYASYGDKVLPDYASGVDKELQALSKKTSAEASPVVNTVTVDKQGTATKKEVVPTKVLGK